MHANNIGDMIGGYNELRYARRWRNSKTCPDCGGPMSEHAARCMSCSSKHTAEMYRITRYSDSIMDRHHRWSALLDAGFTNAEIMKMRPNLPSWSQIMQWAPDEVIKSFCRGMG